MQLNSIWIKKGLLLLAALTLLSGLLLLWALRSGPLRTTAENWGQEQGFLLESSLRDQFFLQKGRKSDPSSLQSFASAQGEVVRAQVFPVQGRQEAMELMRVRLHAIRSLYEPHRVEYVGQISVSQQCVDEQKIQSQVTEDPAFLRSLSFLMASRNFIFGACLPEEKAYHSQHLLLFCEGGRFLLEAKHFVPLPAKALDFPIFSCTE